MFTYKGIPLAPLIDEEVNDGDFQFITNKKLWRSSYDDGDYHAYSNSKLNFKHQVPKKVSTHIDKKLYEEAVGYLKNTKNISAVKLFEIESQIKNKLLQIHNKLYYKSVGSKGNEYRSFIQEGMSDIFLERINDWKTSGTLDLGFQSLKHKVIWIGGISALDCQIVYFAGMIPNHQTKLVTGVSSFVANVPMLDESDLSVGKLMGELRIFKVKLNRQGEVKLCQTNFTDVGIPLSSLVYSTFKLANFKMAEMNSFSIDADNWKTIHCADNSSYVSDDGVVTSRFEHCVRIYEKDKSSIVTTQFAGYLPSLVQKCEEVKQAAALADKEHQDRLNSNIGENTNVQYCY